MLARFPTLLFGFDVARELATAAMGNSDSASGCSTPPPRSARCCACEPRRRADVERQGVLVMHASNQPLKLLQNLRECHVLSVWLLVRGCVRQFNLFQELSPV